MTSIGFIGLGHMGTPMAQNLIKQGQDVYLYDINPEALEEFRPLGGTICESALEAADKRNIIISMLPQGKHDRNLYMGDDGLFADLSGPSFILDCSTIDIETSHTLHEQAVLYGHRLLDAPVSGGVVGAQNAALTFMVGGAEEDFLRAKPILQMLGKNIFHAGEATHGLAAKICNNLMLGIHMVGTSEAFILAEKLGLPKEKLFEIASVSSGQSWTLMNYCPVPGLIPSCPANNNYKPGFSGEMMLKDLMLAIDAAHNADISIPLTEKAGTLYDEFVQEYEQTDFSGIIQYLSTNPF
jgi:3-hydroxyisobutyrate dehydrogenase